MFTVAAPRAQADLPTGIHDPMPGHRAPFIERVQSVADEARLTRHSGDESDLSVRGYTAAGDARDDAEDGGMGSRWSFQAAFRRMRFGLPPREQRRRVLLLPIDRRSWRGGPGPTYSGVPRLEAVASVLGPFRGRCGGLPAGSWYPAGSDWRSMRAVTAADPGMRSPPATIWRQGW